MSYFVFAEVAELNVAACRNGALVNVRLFAMSVVFLLSVYITARAPPP